MGASCSSNFSDAPGRNTVQQWVLAWLFSGRIRRAHRLLYTVGVPIIYMPLQAIPGMIVDKALDVNSERIFGEVNARLPVSAS